MAMLSVKVSMLFFFILWLWPKIAVKGQNLTIDEDNLALAKIVLFLARQHLSKLTPTVVIAEQSLQPEAAYTNIYVMNYLLLKIQDKLSIQLFFSEEFDQPREYYIFIIDSVESFRILRQKFSKNKNNRHFFFLIVLTLFTPDYLQVMSDLFQLCLEMNVYDANVILQHPQDEVCMYIMQIFTEDICRIPKPVLYYKFENNLNDLEKVFPQKLKNFHRCPLKVSCRSLFPFVKFDGNESDPQPVGEWTNLDGIEGYLLRYFAMTLNFTIDVLPFPTERSFAFLNGTSYGCFDDLLQGRADIVIGGFSASDPSHPLFSTSKMIHSSPFKYIVNPREKLSPLGRLAKPFSQQAWALLALLLVFGICFLAKMQLARSSVRDFFYGQENKSPWLNFMAVGLGYPVTRTPRRTFARYLLMMWMLLTFVIRNAYQGALYDAIRLDSYVQIPKGYEDLIKFNYKFLLTPDISEIDLFPENLTIISESIANFDRYRLLEKSEKNLATVAVQDNFLSYMEKAYFEGSPLYVLSETIFLYQVVMYFQKNSILLDAFNKKLSDLITSGLAKHLSTYHTAHPALFSKVYESPPKKPFSNERIVALYEIYFSLTILSLLVFGLELLSVRYRKLRIILEKFNLI